MSGEFAAPRVARMTALAALCVAALSACASYGSLRVEPDERVKGLKSLLDETSPGGTLHVMLVHGMNASEDQRHDDLIKAIAGRLGFAVGKDVPWGPDVPLHERAPNITLFGGEVWSVTQWKRDVPVYRSVVLTPTDVSGRRLAFHAFDYWRALATLKCRYLVLPDTRLVGAHDIAEECRKFLYDEDAKVLPALSGTPRYLNRRLKTELVEWGFGDAVIATSDYRAVLRAAILEWIEKVNDRGAALAAMRPGQLQRPMAPAATFADAISRRDAQLAVITRSLGSYVLLDALSVANSEQSRFVCNARQIHLLANQLGMLQLSELSSGAAAAVARDAPARSLFAPLVHECAPGRQVVAYHEPNDLLSMYVEGRLYSQPKNDQNFKVFNVAMPYARGVPLLFSNPVTAHVGQANAKQLMDLLVFGR